MCVRLRAESTLRRARVRLRPEDATERFARNLASMESSESGESTFMAARFEMSLCAAHVAGLFGPVYHRHGAVFRLRIHHHAEHGAGARSAVNLRPAYGWAMLAESAFFLAYFVFSSPSSKLIEWIGYKQTMVVSLFIQVVGCAAVYSRGQAGELPAVSCRGVHRGRGRDGAADFSESVCRDSRTGGTALQCA